MFHEETPQGGDGGEAFPSRLFTNKQSEFDHLTLTFESLIVAFIAHKSRTF